MKKRKIHICAEQAIPFRPRWTSVMEGFTVNYVKKIYPRLATEHEFADLLQEAYLVYMKCRNKYEGRVDNPAWFMGIYRQALHNHFLDMWSKSFPYISLDDIEEADEPATKIDVGYCWRVLQELPADMRELLAALGLGDISVLPALRKRLRELEGETSTLTLKEI